MGSIKEKSVDSNYKLIDLLKFICAFFVIGIHTRPFQASNMLLDLQAARDSGTFTSVLKKYTKPVLLIIDEWLLLKLTEPEARNLFEEIRLQC